MTTPNALSKPTIYDYLDDPNLKASFEENLAVPCVEERIDSEIKSLLQNDKYFDRDVVERFTPLPGLEQLPLTNVIAVQPHVHCYAISDVHAEYSVNMKWIKDQCVPNVRDGSVFNVLILSGDVATETTMEVLFATLSTSFDAICFVPGNHDLYVLKAKREKTGMDSVQRLAEIREQIKQFPNVYCGPLKVCFGEESFRELVLLPMHSWYHASWDKERDLENADLNALERSEYTAFHARWSDNIYCCWPPSLWRDALVFKCGKSVHPRNVALAEAFAAQNEHFLYPPPSKTSPDDSQATNNFLGCKFSTPLDTANAIHADGVTVISFSHFLPRQELLPEKRFLIDPNLHKVSGSAVLESQVRRLQPHAHVCGHTHVPIDLTLQGIRYLQWPLGNPKEHNKQCQPIAASGPLRVFDSQLGDGNQGISMNLPSRDTPWSKLFRDPTERKPHVIEPLAPWLVKMIDDKNDTLRKLHE